MYIELSIISLTLLYNWLTFELNFSHQGLVSTLNNNHLRDVVVQNGADLNPTGVGVMFSAYPYFFHHV